MESSVLAHGHRRSDAAIIISKRRPVPFQYVWLSTLAGEEHDELDGLLAEISAVMEHVDGFGKPLPCAENVRGILGLHREHTGDDVGIALDRMDMPSRLRPRRNLGGEHRDFRVVRLRVDQRLAKR